MKHTIVFARDGAFAGWPANGGGWQWGQELLVSYQIGAYRAHPTSHCIDREKPIYTGFSRSLDGGLTWKDEPALYDIFLRPVLPVPKGGFDFSAEGFIVRMGVPSVTIRSDRFIVSHDKGHTWEGPYQLRGFDAHPLTMRTSYRVIDAKTMLVFLSWQLPNALGTAYSDRAFAAITQDGGQSFHMLGEMTCDIARSVMPSVAVLKDGTLVAALRRRLERGKFTAQQLDLYAAQTPLSPYWDDNWIEVRQSRDGGRTWVNAVRAAETALDNGHNGNPPALAARSDGTLVLVYGQRSKNPAMMVSVSRDGGKTFPQTARLRQDMATTDFGYPRLFVLPDDRLCAVYYYNTPDRPQQFIASTVFSLEELLDLNQR